MGFFFPIAKPIRSIKTRSVWSATMTWINLDSDRLVQSPLSTSPKAHLEENKPRASFYRPRRHPFGCASPKVGEQPQYKCPLHV